MPLTSPDPIFDIVSVRRFGGERAAWKFQTRNRVADQGEIRSPLVQLAEEFDVAIVFVHHNRKDRGPRPSERLSGGLQIEATHPPLPTDTTCRPASSTSCRLPDGQQKKRRRIRRSTLPNRGVLARKRDSSDRFQNRSNPRLCRRIRHSARVNERAEKTAQREWMGIEPTRPLFRGLTGFEARGSHQIYKHSRVRSSPFPEASRQLAATAYKRCTQLPTVC